MQVDMVVAIEIAGCPVTVAAHVGQEDVQVVLIHGTTEVDVTG